MGDPAVELTQSQLQQIAEYVKAQLPHPDLTERMLVVEQELKAQRELMKLGFEAVDKRFEGVQLQMDKRFSMLQWMWGGGIVLLTLLMTVYEFLG